MEEVQKEGYTGGLSILKDYLRPLRKQAGVVAVRRFETPPGLQAQLDWGKIGQMETPEGIAPLHCLVFTLGHSRALFAQVALDMTLPTLLRLHEQAFSELGGVPREILYDRMKTVVLGTDERGETVFHPVFLDFARYWGFTPRACRPYRPQTKGKVESGVGYVKKSFLSGRKANDLPDLQSQLREWVWQCANVRIHGTTHRRVLEHWQEEKAYLAPLMGRAPYPFAPEHPRKVSRDAFISYRGNRYSVPWRVAGQEVLVRESEGEIAIHRGGERLAVHLLSPPGARQCVVVAQHHEGIPLSPTGRGGKPSLYIALPKNPAPQVQVRSLAAYDLEIPICQDPGVVPRSGGEG